MRHLFFLALNFSSKHFPDFWKTFWKMFGFLRQSETAWNVIKNGVFLVCIFPYCDWISRFKNSDFGHFSYRMRHFFWLITYNLKTINLVKPKLDVTRSWSILHKLQKIYKWNPNCFHGNKTILSGTASSHFRRWLRQMR